MHCLLPTLRRTSKRGSSYARFQPSMIIKYIEGMGTRLLSLIIVCCRGDMRVYVATCIFSTGIYLSPQYIHMQSPRSRSRSLPTQNCSATPLIMIRTPYQILIPGVAAEPISSEQSNYYCTALHCIVFMDILCDTCTVNSFLKSPGL